MQLLEKIGTQTQSAWHRARDAFAEVAAVLVQGDLLFMHFQAVLWGVALLSRGLMVRYLGSLGISRPLT